MKKFSLFILIILFSLTTRAQYSENYNHKELIIKNDSIKIGGTLSWPTEQRADKLVIMITGSGAQDRDATMKPISDFKPFALLAGSLTSNGLATFRYDDRGVGASTGNFAKATLDMLASDVEAIIRHFQKKNTPSFSELILLGHSQGGLVGGKVAIGNKSVDKLILMASTGIPLQKVIRYQVQRAFSRAFVDSALAAKEIDAREQLMDAIKKDTNISKSQKKYRNQFAAIQRSVGMDSSQASRMAQQQVNQLTKTYRSPQLQSLFYYEPTSDLKKLDIPVLVLFGSKDTQVTVEMNKDPIKEALESAEVPYQIEVFPNANHPFQKAKTGKVREYGQLENRFVDGFTSTIVNWIN
ncbi:alpha/beta hydrolase family protein [Fodinibius halophilus]|uniref:Alpha/beta hydrolase n=1 Tax=Fodinibius halophilus TaxID=1736908 RepID=A0A6M1TCS7_9BACT|nr:alpha/beta hydrolase [Fodinibius halophilus]NGP89821.1 alpha/beta hydrolase [Fodinibius halophilus]